MKKTFIFLSAAFLIASCNSTPKASEPTTGTAEKTEAKTTSVTTTADEKKTTSKDVAETQPATTSSEHMSSESANTAKAKKGWSKTAKGAVIGGVVGAGTGAIVAKKHRGTGAVIGGVVGAGSGAIVGNELDKKDGRH